MAARFAVCTGVVGVYQLQEESHALESYLMSACWLKMASGDSVVLAIMHVNRSQYIILLESRPSGLYFHQDSEYNETCVHMVYA